ncbi:spermatogenesis-associated protein 31E1-like [Lemur catta]|uniref:spermatogenesis-associated protein 31E1-like n=1 Tax=Lemur catta TaxID=9447 RepID=UPI001E269BCD|nr:spermatogenesis-associated protein 31E1-like [Lemur catta]
MDLTSLRQRWWAVAKALLLPTSHHSQSQPERLLHHPPEASFWGDPTHRQIKGGDPTFINPDVRELLEMLLTKGAGLQL